MGKVVRVGGRGTSRRVSEKEGSNWAGGAYSDVMRKRQEEAGNRFITYGRGTNKIRFGDISAPTGRSSDKGRYVSTGRGTGRRRIQ